MTYPDSDSRAGNDEKLIDNSSPPPYGEAIAQKKRLGVTNQPRSQLLKGGISIQSLSNRNENGTQNNGVIHDQPPEQPISVSAIGNDSKSGTQNNGYMSRRVYDSDCFKLLFIVLATGASLFLAMLLRSKPTAG